jgi:hypothetical protein
MMIRSHIPSTKNRLNRLHNDPEHLKKMIERQKEDLGAATEDKQKRMKTQRM